MTVNKEEAVYFSYFTENGEKNKAQYVCERSVIITKSRKITYTVRTDQVDVTIFKLPTKLENVSSIPDILDKFKNLRVCEGLSFDVLSYLHVKHSIDNIETTYRHTNCSLLTLQSKRCASCAKYNKNLMGNLKRLKARKSIKRVRGSFNETDKRLVNILRKKVKN